MAAPDDDQVMTRIEYAEALNAKVDEMSRKSALGRSTGQDRLFRQLSILAEQAIRAFGTLCGFDKPQFLCLYLP
ncbi:MAG: hypothetical protein EOO88_33775 [Pedobacter sp.]|nr:MAG: hypothetical protein EOO88_33775 [Pedobacter sp.]